jgi:hypothetical protein
MAKGLNNSNKLMKLWLRFGAYCSLFRPKLLFAIVGDKYLKLFPSIRAYILDSGQFPKNI